ncbi:MAG: circadian clock protein KaiC [Chloroflexi bacterium]|nr:circadian clock protein KaiC [Chloroflexota bacterium]
MSESLSSEPDPVPAEARQVETIGPAEGRLERFETGVPNLDRVLGGGLLRGTIVMIVGPPGSGKTILGQQIAFCAASRREVTLYLTGYSESHDKLLAHNRSLTYFAAEAIGSEVQLGSLPDLLAQDPGEARQAVVATARSLHASLVILDGFRSIRGFLPDDQAAAEFLYSLGATLSMLGTTLIVLVEGDATDRIRDPELSVCDVILSLHRVVRGGGHRREIEVLKVRGAAPLAGLHPFRITADGLTVYPRLESVVPPDAGPWTAERAGFGISELDALISGGLNVGTSTLAAGTPGMGKTVLGLQFLAEGARRGQRGLFAGFIENAAQLRAKARTFGIDLEAAEKAGSLELLTIPPHDLDADVVAWLIRERIEARQVKRLVIDSATELQGGLNSPERATMFMASLSAYLRSQGVTTYMTVDVPTIVGPELSFAGNPLLVFAENLLLLRYAEIAGVLHRVFAVLKMRFSDFDRALRIYTIEDGLGLKIAGPAPPAEGLLTGLARPLKSDPLSQIDTGL